VDDGVVAKGGTEVRRAKRGTKGDNTRIEYQLALGCQMVALGTRVVDCFV